MMPSDEHHRRSVRLPDYAYENGVYFVTICAHERECIFGTIISDEIRLNSCGEIARDEWLQTAVLRANVEVDAFVVMPNHVHALIVLHRNVETREDVGAQHAAPSQKFDIGTIREDAEAPSQRPDIGAIREDVEAQRAAPSPIPSVSAGSLGAVVRSYKSAVARRINLLRNTPAAPVWQRNYHEHVVRDERGLNKLREYVQHNPALWAEDRENPQKK